MKKIFVLFALFCSVTSFAQTGNDATARAKEWVKLNPEMTLVKVFSTNAKSAADLVYSTFMNYGTVPSLSFNDIEAAEKSELEAFSTRLTQTLLNPPTWDEILAKKQEIEKAGPTPPVSANEVAAKGYYAGSGKSSKGSQSSTPASHSQEGNTNPVNPVDPPKE